MSDPTGIRLPDPLSAEQVIALNQPKKDLHTTRTYTWNDWEFEVPPGVFMPGATSRMIHERVLSGDIDVHNRRYAAMGVGLGVEAVAAGVRGAHTIHAADVHPESVEATERNYRRLVGERPQQGLVPLVSDLFEAFPDGTQLDVVTFNPPAVSQPVSQDPDIVRNTCVGASIVTEFFAQLRRRRLLAPGGQVHVVASNTADLPQIVDHAEENGLITEIHHSHDWGDGVQTLLFRFRERGAV
ncbi:methyltransferase [Nocardiopsis xinjiangensis]|uniref:methyltransferase n=1 Tax=Nocardiopsis xinjiangensis TaxID=124285 RepID=UPI00034C2893|nr:methyltransferase [Nocardiopsis xinjiangensis]